jgi:hypothetical protein
MKLDAVLGVARAPRAPEPPVSLFEFWPSWLFYTPVIAHCLLMGVRYRSLTVLTAANPAIPGGGLCGESKLDILDQIGPDVRPLVARYINLRTHDWNAYADLAHAEAEMARADLHYPVVAKPDIACNGTGVRLIANAADLLPYLAAFPREQRVILQEYVPYEGEAGLFYIRHPEEAHGRITSVTLKYAPYVVGDGRSTLRALILADARAGRVSHLYLPRLGRRLHEVPPAGAPVRLVFVGNHCKGSIFRNGIDHATPELTTQVERIASSLPDFHFGRIDIRFESIGALRRGEGFRVIEVNGVGSEATHVWDPRTKLWDAWRDQFYHYGQAYRIGAANRARGERPLDGAGIFRMWRLQKRLMRSYPVND